MIDQATTLRQAYDKEKQRLIEELIKCGYTKLEDGRQLYELTLTELLDEMRWVNMQREGDMIV